MDEVGMLKNRLYEIYMNGASDMVDGMIKAIKTYIANDGDCTTHLSVVIEILQSAHQTFVQATKKVACL